MASRGEKIKRIGRILSMMGILALSVIIPLTCSCSQEMTTIEKIAAHESHILNWISL